MKLKKVINLAAWRKWLLAEVGKPCKDYLFDCIICRSWRLYRKVEAYVQHMDSL